MLKILEENSIGMALKIFWKQFVGLATGLKTKYFGDPFFRSEFNVILLQIVFAGTLVLLVGLYFDYVYRQISETIVSGIMLSIANGIKFSGADIAGHITDTKNSNFTGFIIITSLITITFSYFIAHITLAPVRNALKIQKRFISDIAHELRTPLSVIKTNTEVLLLDNKIESKLRNTMVSNIEELDRTSDIINNLLSFSNLIKPDRINFGAIDLRNVITAALAKMTDFAEKRKVILSSNIEGNFIVWGNATALEQIITNLLKNAISYTPVNGKVDLKAEPDYQNNAIITIKDTGIGIDNKDLAHIFEPFYRAERSRNRQHGSSGLGLTIVSELIKVHSGRITVKSELNKGTLVTVLLPRSNVKNKINNPKKESANNEISLDFVNKK